MPTIEQHIEQWKHNRRFAATIEAQFRDWQITAIFYSALHAVDAALAKHKIIVADHQGRNYAVKHNAAFSSLRDKYMNLYRISRVTRYDADPDKWLPRPYLTAEDLVNDLLKPIETEVEKILQRQVVSSSVNLKK